jgi:hypothetical protein
MFYSGSGRPSRPFVENSGGLFSSRRGTNTPGGALWGFDQVKNKYGTTAACCNATESIQTQSITLSENFPGGAPGTFTITVNGVDYSASFTLDANLSATAWILAHTSDLADVGITVSAGAPGEIVLQGSLEQPTFSTVFTPGTTNMSGALSIPTYVSTGQMEIKTPQLRGFYPSVFKNNISLPFGYSMAMGEFCNNC